VSNKQYHWQDKDIAVMSSELDSAKIFHVKPLSSTWLHIQTVNKTDSLNNDPSVAWKRLRPKNTNRRWSVCVLLF